MNRGSWTLDVRDGRGRVFQGVVHYADRVPVLRRALSASEAFRIVLLAQPREVDNLPEATAVCVPAVRAIRAVGAPAARPLPERIEQLTMPPHEMRAFSSGSIVTQPPDIVDPSDIFPVQGEHPRLDRLGRALIEVAEAEAVAAYLAVVRHELRLPPGADALVGLEARLAPSGAGTKPPARAPAARRLKVAAKDLRRGFAPDGSLEQLVDDLQFLLLFGDDAAPLTTEALSRLLDDVTAKPPKRRASSRKREPARVIPFPPRKDG